MLYECLTGEVPYKRPSEAAVLFSHVSDPPPLVSEHRADLPPALDEVIARGMAKQPEERYASPLDLLDDAAQVIAARGSSAAPPVDRLPPPPPTTLASLDAIAPTVPSEHQLEAVPLEAVADHESTALLTPPDGTAVVPQAEERSATTELEHAAPEAFLVPDWGLDDKGSGTEFDWGRGTRDGARLDAAPPRRAGSRWPLAAGAVALLGLAVAVAIVAGGGGGSGGGTPPAPTPPAPGQATASGIGLRYPTTWQPADAPPDALPGTSARWPIALAPVGAAAGTLVLAGRLPSRGSTLLPADLVAGLPGAPPAPTPVRLGAVDAYRYAGLAPRGSERRADVYVVPTSTGVVTLACVAAAAPPPSFTSDCMRILESLTVSGARTYPLGPDRTFTKRLNGAMTALNARRGPLRRRLRAERRAAGQARDAGGLARAFTSAAGTVAAGTVSPAVAPDRTAIVKAMRRATAEYRALAHAAAHHDRRAYNRARTGVRRAERTLSRAL